MGVRVKGWAEGEADREKFMRRLQAVSKDLRALYDSN
jgi:hypothetical protein